MDGTGERLPWLTDEPAPKVAPRSAPAKAKTGRAMWPVYLLFTLLIAAVGVGAWWLGTRQREAAPPELPAESPLAIPVAPAQRQPAPEPALPEATNEIAPPEQFAAAPARPARRTPQPSVQADPPQALEEESAAQADQAIGRSVFPADDTVIAPPPVTGPAPVAVYRPLSNRGRVVQLGAFPTRSQAEEVWRRVTRRYPYLASKPKMINTVDVRALGGGRRARMYRLQLGTSSQAQSVVICQQLERAGQSCVVVY